MFKENVRHGNSGLYLGRKVKVIGASFGDMASSLHARMFLEILELCGNLTHSLPIGNMQGKWSLPLAPYLLLAIFRLLSVL